MIHNGHPLRASIARQKHYLATRSKLPCARLVLLLRVLHPVSGARDLRLGEGQLGLGGSRASRLLLTVRELSLALALVLRILVRRRDDGRGEGCGLCVDGLRSAEIGMSEGLGGRYALGGIELEESLEEVESCEEGILNDKQEGV